MLSMFVIAVWLCLLGPVVMAVMETLDNIVFKIDLDKIPPATVKTLDQKAYAGRWFQMYASVLPNKTFEYDGFCLTADYTIDTPTSFKVVNSEKFGGPTGDLKQYKAELTLNDPKSPGKWELNSKWFGFYWVIAVGDIDPVTGLYPWAVVSGPLKLQLFVLARDVAVFESTFKGYMLNYLNTTGFDKHVNKPLKTYQGPDCIYAPVV